MDRQLKTGVAGADLSHGYLVKSNLYTIIFLIIHLFNWIIGIIELGEGRSGRTICFRNIFRTINSN